jgi:hypothetical protein
MFEVSIFLLGVIVGAVAAPWFFMKGLPAAAASAKQENDERRPI